MLLVVDNGSVYIKEISKILSKNDIVYTVIPFDQIAQVDMNNSNLFILSGRRKNNKKMNAINSKIIHHVISEKKSLLGICYGAEILALTLGGTIRKLGNSVNGIQKVKIIAPNSLSEKDIEAFQSHSYEISKLGNQLQNFGSSDTCQYEIIKHQTLPMFGTQFHPEMSKDGQLLIESFLKIIH